MNPEELQKSIDIIKTNLEPVAERLGQSAQWTFELFVRQVYVNAFSGLLWLVPGILCLYFAKKLSKIKQNEFDIPKWFEVVPLVFIGLVLILFPISDLIQALVNPNYQAIKLIFYMVTNKTGN